MLLSTIDDYWAFVAMVRAAGVHRGERVLPGDLVRRMTTDQLDADQRAGNELFLDVNGGWGLGMGTAATGSEAAPLPCGYGWEGGSGTSWRTHAESGVTGILLTQRAVTSPAPTPITRLPGRRHRRRAPRRHLVTLRLKARSGHRRSRYRERG